MALSGSFSKYPVTASYGNFGLYCEWSGTQSISGNYTDITLKVYLRYYSLNIGSRDDSIVSINGIKETYTVPAINHNAEKDYYKLIKTYTVRVSHNSDGTKSCTLSASWRMNGTYGGTSVGTITASTTVTLDTIARASSISSASNVILGNACSIKWTPTSSSFKYKVKFSIGSWSHTTDYISPKTTSAYTYTGYKIPIVVANQLPKVTTGIMTVYLYTYNGTTRVGSAASKTFTITIPSSVIPTLGTVTASIVNSNSVINSWGVAVAGYTKVKIEATASGSYGSLISSFTISDGYSTTQNGTSLSYTGSAITSSGSKTFTVVAKDSRSRSSVSKTTNEITFYPYSKPTISSFTAARSDSDAKKVIVKGNWIYSDINGKNAITATLQYKKSTESNWTNYGTIDRNIDVILTTDFNETYSYNFRLVVTDSLNQSAQDEAFVSTIAVLIDFRAGGKGLGIGKIAESDNFEVALNSIFIGDVYIKIDSSNVPLKTYIKKVINGDYD